MTAILGISAFYHDAAAALVVDGRVVAAAQEERFSRKKHDDAFPAAAVAACLRQAGLEAGDLDFVGFYDKPYLKFDRLLETYLAFAPTGFVSFARALPLWMRMKLHLPRELRNGLGGAYRKRYAFAEHHESHAASAFFPSPFEEAAILTLDGVGEWTTAAWGVGRGNRFELTHAQHFPHSLGLLYSAFTYYTGFEVNSGEYKLMGLAPYGKPVWVDAIREKLLDLKDDGSFRLDLSYFNYCQGLTMTSRRFDALFGAPPRRAGEPIRPLDKDVAASIQVVTEEIMLRSAIHVHERTGLRNLCLAGGVALNCVGNGRILREGPFERLWIQPAAGDAGGALGVALLLWHQLLGHERHPAPEDAQRGSLLGESFDDDAIAAFLAGVDAHATRLADDEALCAEAAAAIDAGAVVGWFQGPMEFGPRALGSRSILGDARHPDMQSRINRKVKFREGFRPFAPCVLRESAASWFDLPPEAESPYMLLVAPVAEGVGGSIPSVTHVDGSARVQTVDAGRFPLLHRLLCAFHTRTGCPVLVNTSFNLGWEPIVRTPKDAYATFMTSGLDVLFLGHHVLRKSEQPATVRPPSTTGSGDAAGAALADGILGGLLAAPCCGGDLSADGDALRCVACERTYPVTEGIPQLVLSAEATGATSAGGASPGDVRVPDGTGPESIRSLLETFRRQRVARRLDESLPYNSLVLEVGCGAGRLASFLGVSCRRVVATDPVLGPLRSGERFRREHGLDRVRFVQMDPRDPALRPGRFDVVLCNGARHSATDPFDGLERVARLVRPGGHLVLRLDDRWGGMFADARRLLGGLQGIRPPRTDPVRRTRRVTSGPVLAWLERNGFDFVRGVPAMRLDDDGLDGETLFAPQPPGTPLERGLAQAARLVGAGREEEGAVVLIGRKRGGA